MKNYTITPTHIETAVIITETTADVYGRPRHTYVELSAQLDRDTATYRTKFREPHAVDYTASLMRSIDDKTRCNYITSRIADYISADAYQAAIQQLDRNLAQMKREIKAGQRTPFYKAMKPHAARIIKHYHADFTFSDALTLGRADAPARFIWIVRTCGTWIIRENSAWTREVLESTNRSGDYTEFYLFSPFHPEGKKITAEQAANYMQSLPEKG